MLSTEKYEARRATTIPTSKLEQFPVPKKGQTQTHIYNRNGKRRVRFVVPVEITIKKERQTCE